MITVKKIIKEKNVRAHIYERSTSTGMCHLCSKKAAGLKVSLRSPETKRVIICYECLLMLAMDIPIQYQKDSFRITVRKSKTPMKKNAGRGRPKKAGKPTKNAARVRKHRAMQAEKKAKETTDASTEG